MCIEGNKIVGPLLLVLILVFSAVIMSMPETASALDPPVLDGLIDTIYYTGSVAYYANSSYPEASGYVYIIDNTNIDPNYAWVAWVINSSYVDNTYGTGTVGPYRTPNGNPCGHDFDDLNESDGQEFKFYNCTNELVFHAFFDLVHGPGLPTNSSYGIPAWGAGEPIITTGNGSLVDYNTSTSWNLNTYYNTSPYDVTVNSPTLDQNYTLHENYTNWEVRHIYEIRLNRTLFGGCSMNVPATELLQLHASPNKIGPKGIDIDLVGYLGDLVWEDLDADGIQDTGEPGIPDVQVSLYTTINGTLTVVKNTTTDLWGLYKFPDLAAGTYSVNFELPAGYLLSPRYQGVYTNDSDANETGWTGQVSITGNESNITMDTGMYQPASLGDYVWGDLDRDGIQDFNESGIANVTVSLFYGNGIFIRNTTTDADGLYRFTNLTPGDYYVKFVNPNESYYAGFSPQDQGANDTLDSDANTTGYTTVTTLEAYETDLSWDCGLPPIPEQSTIVLLSVGLLTLMGYVSYTRKKER